jgi:hypothetical protein
MMAKPKLILLMNFMGLAPMPSADLKSPPVEPEEGVPLPS